MVSKPDNFDTTFTVAEILYAVLFLNFQADRVPHSTLSHNFHSSITDAILLVRVQSTEYLAVIFSYQ